MDIPGEMKIKLDLESLANAASSSIFMNDVAEDEETKVNSHMTRVKGSHTIQY
ncbi:hypothetical protein [Maribacter sp.]|uniref:hypothetical protein n=1 Tax=Maribacter sp. TaxID=1897614 RepID=UPI003C782D77